MAGKFGKSWFLLACQNDLVTLLTNDIVAHSFTRERFPGFTLIFYLISTKYLHHYNLDSKNWTTKPLGI